MAKSKLDQGLTLGILALAALTIAIGVWMERSQFRPTEQRLSSGFTNRVLAMEFVRTPGDVQEIVGELGDPNREVMRGKVQKDFSFIPAYALLFAALGWLLGRGNYRFAILLSAAIAASAAGAAAFDVMENRWILRILDVRLAGTSETMLDGVQLASLIKWALVFAAMALLTPIAILRRELFTLPIGPPWLTTVFGVIIALAYLLAAIIGLIGLSQNPLIEKASIFMSLALFLTVLLLSISVFNHRRPASDSQQPA